MKKLQAIGSKIFVDFPAQGSKKIPAKVDTGADSSSVWASGIREKNGRLEFSLFAPSSPFYTGEIIETAEYKIRSVKNSFGQSQFRYKVPLRVKVGSKIINANFNLADRSNNRYPVLIGRRTLRGKFLVDVTKNPKKTNFNVLVLDVKPIGSVRRFFEGIQSTDKKLNFTLATHSDLVFRVDRASAGVTLKDSGQDVADFDYVFIKSVMVEKPLVVALAKYLDRTKTPYMDRANSFYPLNNKLAQYIELQTHEIPVPRSILIHPEHLAKSFGEMQKFLRMPFVLKDIGGSKGRDNYLVSSPRDFKKAVKKAKKGGKLLIGQEFIENGGDYRILVFGHKIRLVIHRQKTGKSHLNNTSMGGSASMLEEKVLPGFVRRMSLDAANLLKLDIAGVDMMQDSRDGSWYCLEVNHGPQITSGSFVPQKREKFAEFIRRRLEKDEV